MSNFKYILSAFVILFIVSCAQEDAVVSGETGPIYKGPYYNEFLACNAGPEFDNGCLLYTSPSPRDRTRSRMPSSA